MWCKVSHFVKIHMLRLRASDLGIGASITEIIWKIKQVFKILLKFPRGQWVIIEEFL